MVDTRSRSTAPGQQAAGASGDENMDMGNPAENLGESASTHTHEDDMLEETVEQRYERMVAQIRIKRMEESIEALEAELAGDTRTPRIEIAGLPIREKRHASSGPANQPMAQMPRLAKPPYFKGRNLKDAADYEAGWKIHLQASKSMSDQERIAYAATYLDDRARAAWGQEDRPATDCCATGCCATGCRVVEQGVVEQDVLQSSLPGKTEGGPEMDSPLEDLLLS